MTMEATAPAGTKRKTLKIVKIYADGRRPRNLGLVSFTSPDPIENWFWNTWIKLKEAVRGQV